MDHIFERILSVVVYWDAVFVGSTALKELTESLKQVFCHNPPKWFEEELSNCSLKKMNYRSNEVIVLEGAITPRKLVEVILDSNILKTATNVRAFCLSRAPTVSSWAAFLNS